MKFCNQCGASVVLNVPPGDNRRRYVCAGCGVIHYENPRIVAGCVAGYEGAILLCKRAIEPRYGYWTVPAGFMELDESLPDAAARETREEAEARVTIGPMIACVDVIQAHQVHIFFAGTLDDPEYGAGHETLEAGLYDPTDIPWAELAFPSVRIALEQYLRNRESGSDDLLVCTAPRRSIL
ncbi:MAG: NUDIX hydrolase [Gammaproteobacteria bacterium]|nr:MAG: NUDIX hydrolase [Gammaproteobacteria bacterium]